MLKKISYYTLLLLIILGSVEISLRIFSSYYYNKMIKLKSNVSFQENEVRILCIGESTTALGGSNSYPAQLQVLLNQNSPSNKTYTVINEGKPAASTDIVLKKINPLLVKYSPHYVITMLGINDSVSQLDNLHLPNYLDIQYSYFWNFKITKLFILLRKYVGKAFQEKENASFHSEVKNTSKENQELEEEEDIIIPLPLLTQEKVTKGIRFYSRKNYISANKIFDALTPDTYQKIPRGNLIEIAISYLNVGNELKTLNIIENYIYKKIGRKDARQKDHIYTLAKPITDYSDANGFHDINFSEKVLKEIHEIVPENVFTIGRLAALYHAASNSYTNKKEIEFFSSRAIYFAEKYVNLNGESIYVYLGLADEYRKLKKHNKAITLLKPKIMAGRKEFNLLYAYIELMIEVKDYKEAKKFILEGRDFFPAIALWHQKYSTICKFLKDCSSLDNFFPPHKKNGITQTLMEDRRSRVNYLSIVEQISKFGSKIIVMQYPLREVQPLKELLLDYNINFVSNVEPFKSQLKKVKSEELFTDQFAGDFGHATKLGNKFISENVFKKIIELEKSSTGQK
jgi:hypothetical protein